MDFRLEGRRVTENQFFKGIEKNLLDAALLELEKRAHGAAASILDPETGRHASVFVRRIAGGSLIVNTAGSPAFAIELEKRLGVPHGTVSAIGTIGSHLRPHVYLAHATNDKDDLARPLAHALMDKGINVWFDEWEMGIGDSLRQKMEGGLDECTHFLVLLTPNSIGKPWVEQEIDAGLMNAIDGKAKFMGVRVGVDLNKLSVFLRTKFCPKFDPNSESDFNTLVGDIFGVSRKPLVGPMPHYVAGVPTGLQAGVLVPSKLLSIWCAIVRTVWSGTRRWEYQILLLL